ncbi:hypothetical protein [Pacificibacter marinus]|uniref:hypothetical protein n=1 Tax=Pacificibacter marinus TaxID=658057 RepID=UPI001C06FC93|nr:hypothetical protein [Pacificibacter marinus]MBU2866052.1 hypothetical protein [Pacificibacter marinus]
MPPFLRAVLLIICTTLTLPSVGVAQGDYWEFGDWRVMVDEVDTGEDLRRTCTMVTGGDGDMSAVLTISNGDAGPPDYFPELMISDHAIRHHSTVLKQDAPLYLHFDDEDVIDGSIIQYIDAEGFQHAEARFPQAHSQWVLLAMKRNNQMDVMMNNTRVHVFSLSGFSASYLKMVDECGFTDMGVLDRP